MQKYCYTIIETPIGFIVPFWFAEPCFYLQRVCIVDTSFSLIHMFDEFDCMGIDNEKALSRQQFIQDFERSNRIKELEKLFKSYSVFVKSSHHHIRLFRKSLDLYFSLKIDIKFSPDLLNLENFSNFARSVLFTLKDIPIGQVISYGHLAELSGYSKAFRAVGSVMNKNPFPLIIPCHRVIRSNGNIGEFALGKDMKKYLLKHESLK